MAQTPRSAIKLSLALLISGSLLIPSALTAQAAETPAPSSSATGTYEEQLAAYKIAMDAYKISLDKYKQDRRTVEAAHKVAIGKYELDVIAFEEKYKVELATINEAFKAAIDKARSDLRNSQSSANTAEARNALRIAMNAAVMTATKTRKSAIDALGDIPVKPERPVFAPPPFEPRKPMPNLKGNRNQKMPPNPQVQPNKPGSDNNQQPAPNVQSKVNKPAKNQNASGDSENIEIGFSA
jgi:cation transport regulator ChaB